MRYGLKLQSIHTGANFPPHCSFTGVCKLTLYLRIFHGITKLLFIKCKFQEVIVSDNTSESFRWRLDRLWDRSFAREQINATEISSKASQSWASTKISNPFLIRYVNSINALLTRKFKLLFLAISINSAAQKVSLTFNALYIARFTFELRR